MYYREANIDEHQCICKQVRSRSVLTVCLLAPVLPLTLLATILSINMMIRKHYDRSSFVVSTVLLVMFFIAVAVFIIPLMGGFIKRISYINKHKYFIGDCIVSGRSQRRNPKHNHWFVTVRFPAGNEYEVMTSASVYAMAEMGKPALFLKYDEPGGMKKLPFEVAIQ